MDNGIDATAGAVFKDKSAAEIAVLQGQIETTKKQNELIKEKNALLDQELANKQKEKAVLAEVTPSGTTTGKGGDLAVDDKPRYLAEIVANHALAKVAEDIAEKIKGFPEMLIVDDLNFAAADVTTKDIEQKIKALKALIDDHAVKCADFAKKTAVPVVILDVEKYNELAAAAEAAEGDGKPAKLGAVGLVAGLGALATAGTVISGTLSAAGDILGYFRADYDIKGQTVQNLTDLTIQAMVAGRLKTKGVNVHLPEFRLELDAQLLKDLNALIAAHLKLLACLETIDPAAGETAVSALETELAALRTKLAGELLKVNDKAIKALKAEIAGVEGELGRLGKGRLPDAQISALETHLAALYSKLVEKVAADSSAAEAALRAELDEVTKALEKGDLSAAKKKELEGRSTNLQQQLTAALVNKHSQAVANLKKEITAVTNELAAANQKRVPDAQISGLETHLAGLRTKLQEMLATNAQDSRAELQAAIDRLAKQIADQRVLIEEAKDLKSGATVITGAVTTFLTTITTAPADGGLTPLVKACLRQALIARGIQHLVKLHFVSAGAELIIEKRAMRLADTSYVGGGVVTYLVADINGQVLAADTVSGIAALNHRIGEAPKKVRLDWGV